jgi:hypothetical protein
MAMVWRQIGTPVWGFFGRGSGGMWGEVKLNNLINYYFFSEKVGSFFDQNISYSV